MRGYYQITPVLLLVIAAGIGSGCAPWTQPTAAAAAVEPASTRAGRAREIRRTTADAMLGEAQKRCDGGELREAADLLRQAAVIDPPNEKVQGLLRVVLGRIELRRAKVADMVAEARRLWDANQFKEAINLLRQAVIFDPLDADAARLLFVALDKSDLGREIIPISGPRSAEPGGGAPNGNTATNKPGE